MTTVYMVRHAEAEGNLYRRVHGWYNSLITDNGYRQIAALRGRFADIHIDAVYSSDLFRTMTTAKAVYLSHGLELHTDPGLREISLGAWEDKPWGELERCDAMNLIRFNHSSPDFRVEGGETFAQVQARLKGTVLRLAAAHPGQTISANTMTTGNRYLNSLNFGRVFISHRGFVNHRSSMKVRISAHVGRSPGLGWWAIVASMAFSA